MGDSLMQHATQNFASDASVARTSRSTAPVFVVGCPRSGTTYLYHVLLSAENFAIYRAESEVFHLLEPRFGDLSVARNKKRLLATWFESRLFAATGLQKEPLQERLMRECRDGGDFLRIVMEEMARHQGVQRWAECTPDHVLYLPRIKQTIPNALVIHIIRDGRDVALSMEKQGWPKQLPWDRMKRRMAGGLYWEWMVRKGHEDGARMGPDYIEVRYEDLVSNPRDALKRLSLFVDQELDFDVIRRAAIGSVAHPNTSFQEEGGGFMPVGRWKKFYSAEEAAMFETFVGKTLQQFGYVTSSEADGGTWRLGLLRAQYVAFVKTKFYLRTKTPLGKFLVDGDLSKM